MTFRFGLSVGVYGYDPDALAYFAALATAPSAGFKAVVNTLVSSLKSAGIWTGLDTFYILASEADGVDDYGINLVNPATYTLTNTNTPTWTQYVGTQGDGSTSYHNMNVVLNTLTNFVEDSASMFCWVQAWPTIGVRLIGDAATSHTLANANNTQWSARISTLTTFTINNSTPYTTVPHSLIASRTGATATDAYYDGVVDETQSAQTSDFPPDAGSFHIHHNGQPSFGNAQLAFAGLGRGLSSTEALALHNAMAAANTALGLL